MQDHNHGDVRMIMINDHGDTTMIALMTIMSQVKESRETREKTSQTSPKKPLRSLGKKSNGQTGSDQVREACPKSDFFKDNFKTGVGDWDHVRIIRIMMLSIGMEMIFVRKAGELNNVQ